MLCSFTDGLVLKHIYSAKFDIQEAVERLIKVSAYHNNALVTKIDRETIQRL